MLVGYPSDSIPRRLAVFGVNSVFFLGGGIAVTALVGGIGLFGAALVGGPLLDAYLFVTVLYGLRVGTVALGRAADDHWIRRLRLAWSDEEPVEDDGLLEFLQSDRDGLNGPPPRPGLPIEFHGELLGKPTLYGWLARSADPEPRVTDWSLLVEGLRAITYVTVLLAISAILLTAGPLLGGTGTALGLGVGLLVVESMAVNRFRAGPVSAVIDWIWRREFASPLRIRAFPLIGADY